MLHRNLGTGPLLKPALTQIKVIPPRALHRLAMKLRSELVSARVPRYTSYPTAPHFNVGVNPETFRLWLRELPREKPLSLYFHIPFCDSLCWFCGCHTRAVNNYSPIASYLEMLRKELIVVSDLLGETRMVSHIHFGGGSPTILSPQDIARLAGQIRERFEVLQSAEFAVEIDPRGLTNDTIEAFAKSGVTRASVGVQDINPIVQRAINRWQPESVTRDAVQRLRGAGISALNIDVMYGLPFQNDDDVRRTLDATLALEPDRLSLFGYAHVPDMKPHQKLIDETSLPSAEDRMRHYDLAQAILVEHGYQPIGLDHFAVPTDHLAIAARTGRLFRNFQGYTTDNAEALIGFGASAISSLPQGYAQNTSDAPGYRTKIAKGEIAIARGRALTSEDRLRRTIIERLMCDLTVDIDKAAAPFGKTASDFNFELNQLKLCQQDGYVQVEGNRITVPDSMRMAVRLVCAVFDAYLTPQTARHAVAV